MPAFTFVGLAGEHIVGLAAGDLTAAQYDALSDQLKQAVVLNRGSNGLALYAQLSPWEYPPLNDDGPF